MNLYVLLLIAVAFRYIQIKRRHTFTSLLILVPAVVYMLYLPL